MIVRLYDAKRMQSSTALAFNVEGHIDIVTDETYNESVIVFAMMRYPIVRDIIKTCAEHFDELNRECGDGARNVTMDHLIEVNSGNNLKD